MPRFLLAAVMAAAAAVSTLTHGAVLGHNKAVLARKLSYFADVDAWFPIGSNAEQMTELLHTYPYLPDLAGILSSLSWGVL